MTKRTSGGRRRAPNPLRPSGSAGIPAAPHPGGPTLQPTGSVTSALERLLETPHLARLVPHLPPETLHQLIRHSGLDACGELVAAATPAQVASILDLDLWRHPQPGRDEQFDTDRFGEWVEVLVEAGATVAARIVAAMDEQLVTAGLSRYIRVFDPSAIAPPTSSDDELMEIEPPSGVHESEVGGYLVCATRADAWDAIVALLLALEADHHDCFHAVMRGCRRLSNSIPEVDGLDDLLTEPEQLLHDVAVGREHRRSALGYSTPADARAFLQMARQPQRHASSATPAANPLAAAYFRAVDEAAASVEGDGAGNPAPALEPASSGYQAPEALDAVMGLLAEAGLVPQQPRALLADAQSDQPRHASIRPLMEYVRATDDPAGLARDRELAFLANTLMAGCSVQSRSFTIQEASDAVVGICNLGLEHWPARWPGAGKRPATTCVALPETFLVDHDLVTAFEVGWAVLYQDVTLFVTDRLIVVLGELRCIDAEIQSGLNALQRELVKQRQAGTPWRAREALEVLAMLDLIGWASLVGLLDECPVLPAALTATLERQTGAVDPTAFTFISSVSQIDAVRAFLARLPDILSR